MQQRARTGSTLFRANSHSILRRGSSLSSLRFNEENKKTLESVQALLVNIEKRMTKAKSEAKAELETEAKVETEIETKAETHYLTKVRGEGELACQLRSDLRTIIFDVASLLKYGVKIDVNLGAKLRKCGQDLEVNTAELDLENTELCVSVSAPPTPKSKS